MRRYIYNISFILMVALVFTACDPNNNWFNHAVKYNGEVEDPKMVVTANLVAGEAPRIFVNQSYFFLDSAALDTIYYTYTNGKGEVFSDWRTVNRRGYLRDAIVEMQVNGADWISLSVVDTAESQSFSYSDEFSVPCVYYTCSSILQPGDSVDIRVSHAKYPTATASQRIPLALSATISAIDTVSHKDASLIGFNLNLPQYKGASTDILCVIATYYLMYEHNDREILGYKYDRINGYIPIYGPDTVYRDYYSEVSFVYSQAIDCSLYDNVNKSLSGGYYGGGSCGLLFSTSTDAPRTLSLFCSFIPDSYSENSYEEDIYYRREHTDSIVLDVMVLSRDAYLNLASLKAGGYHGYYQSYVPDPFSQGSSGDNISDITDIFDEMGTMEGIQVYDNVDGAIGHVTASSRQHFVIDLSQTE